MNLELSLKQALKLSPQMLQSMEILQMSTLELNEYIQELVQENPAAELTEPADPGDEGEELWRRLQSLADLDHQNRQYVTADRDELDPLARVGTDGGLEDTLLLHLTRQLERSHASTLVLRGAQFLAACLDEDGYLRDSVSDLAQAAGLPAPVLEDGLALLQTLDPPGVGAQDLAQCLAIQLRRRGETGPALTIVQSTWSGWPGSSTTPSPRTWGSPRRRCARRRSRSSPWTPGPAPPLPAGRSPTT